MLDAYCGVGTIALAAARRARDVLGVEIVAPAVADAVQNARRNGMDGRAHFVCADAASEIPRRIARGERFDAVILDPPRKGADEKLLRALLLAAPPRIVYVSCDPATLARDVRILCEGGYQFDWAQPVDMFPWTGHVETVVLLSKLKVDHHIEIELKMDELDLTAAESKATYDEIKAYVLNKYGLKVSQLYIAQIKRKCGIIERKNYNVSKKEDAKVPQCPPEKEAAIMDALKHFQMI